MAGRFFTGNTGKSSNSNSSLGPNAGKRKISQDFKMQIDPSDSQSPANVNINSPLSPPITALSPEFGDSLPSISMPAPLEHRLQDELGLSVRDLAFVNKSRRTNVVTRDVDTAWTECTPKDEATRKLLLGGLRSSFMFEPLLSKEINEVIDVMRMRKVAANQVLFHENDEGDFFYFVQSGTLTAYKKQEQSISTPSSPIQSKLPPNLPMKSEKASTESFSEQDISFQGKEADFNFPAGNQLAVRTYGQGECFGELSLLHKQKRAASMVAETDSILWLIDRVTFKTACEATWKQQFRSTVDILRNVPLLKLLTTQQLESVAQVARFQDFPAGEVIIKQGDSGSEFFMVQSGTLEVTKDQQLMTNLRENDFFGELALIHDQPRAATVTTTSSCTLVAIDRVAFTNILGPIRELVDDNVRAFALQRVGLFRDLPAEVRVKLFKEFKEVTFFPGDVIIRQGDLGDLFYVIRTGSVRIFGQMDLDERFEQRALRQEHLRDLGPGDHFGEMAFVNGKGREASVVCVERADCFVLHMGHFQTLSSEAILRLQEDAAKRQQGNLSRLKQLQKMYREQQIRNLLKQVNPNATANSVAGSLNSIPSNASTPLATSTTSSYNSGQSGHSGPPGKTPPVASQTQSQSFSGKFQLQHFQATKTLGTGTFGRVKLVVHIPTGGIYALKIQSKFQIMKYNLRMNIFNEKAALQRVSHPFIVRLFETFQDNDSVYMLLELVQGGELFSVLQNYGARLITPHHVFYVGCVLSALQTLHSMNVIYRDLKPENLIVDYRGYLKLVDFGFAKEANNRTYTLCGTPEYFSPELVLGKGYGKGNDVWALGILAYELVSGYTPFGSSDEPQSELYRKILKSELLFPSDCVDVKGMHLISRLLDKTVSTRLGCDRMGIGGVQLHDWFAGFRWDLLLNKRLPPPWQPKITSPTDTSNFDEYEETYKVIPFRCDSATDPFAGF